MIIIINFQRTSVWFWKQLCWGERINLISKIFSNNVLTSLFTSSPQMISFTCTGRLVKENIEVNLKTFQYLKWICDWLLTLWPENHYGPVLLINILLSAVKKWGLFSFCVIAGILSTSSYLVIFPVLSHASISSFPWCI